jgi:hypothetical protein
VALPGLIVSQSACTAIGYGIGSAIDSGSRQRLAPESFAPDTIEPGKTLKLRLRDGGVVEGKYLGLEPLPAEEYAARYAWTREQHLVNVPLPELGDTVTLCMTWGGELDAEFLGFDLYKVLVRKLGEPGPESVRPGDIDMLRVRGNAAIGGETLALLLSEGAFPFHSAVAMQVQPAIGLAGGKRLLPMDEVLFIEWNSGTARTAGTIVGATIDVAILVAAVYCAASECLMGPSGWY